MQSGVAAALVVEQQMVVIFASQVDSFKRIKLSLCDWKWAACGCVMVQRRSIEAECWF